MAVHCCLLFRVEASFCRFYFAVCTCNVRRHSLDAQMCVGASMQKFMMQIIACLNFSCKWAQCLSTACKVLDNTDVADHRSTLYDVLVCAWERKSGTACVCKRAQVLLSPNLHACIYLVVDVSTVYMKSQ